MCWILLLAEKRRVLIHLFGYEQLNLNSSPSTSLIQQLHQMTYAENFVAEKFFAEDQKHKQNIALSISILLWTWNSLLPATSTWFNKVTLKGATLFS